MEIFRQKNKRRATAIRELRVDCAVPKQRAHSLKKLTMLHNENSKVENTIQHLNQNQKHFYRSGMYRKLFTQTHSSLFW